MFHLAGETMPRTPPRTSPPERQDTDRSLEVERKKSDTEIGKRDVVIERRSDAVIERARERADAVLENAREHANDALRREGSSNVERKALKRERAQQDSEVRLERFDADEHLEDERQQRLVALRDLLRLEREETDERLLIERARGDASVAARDDYMDMVSHDLRTLLGGIALAASVQIRNATDDKAGQRNLKAAEKIQRLTARVNRLIGDLVDVASIEAGRFEIARTEQDAGRLVQESMDAFEPTASARQISLEASVPEGPLPAMFDHHRILQVLSNLVSNAIKFAGTEGSVCVRAESMGGEVRISVTDTGIGIAPDDLELVFKKFWQVSEGDRRGLGLGLFISRCIVEAHGGRIWAESEPGKGATFTFTLPAPSRVDAQPGSALH